MIRPKGRSMFTVREGRRLAAAVVSWDDSYEDTPREGDSGFGMSDY